MFNFLYKILGSLTAMFLYSTKSLLINLAIILLSLVAFPIVAPFLALLSVLLLRDIIKIRAERNLPFYIMFAAVVSLILTPALLLSIIIVFACISPLDFIKSAIRGAKEGFQDDWFFLVFNHVIFDVLAFNTVLKTVLGSGLENDELSNLYGNLEDLPRALKVIANRGG